MHAVIVANAPKFDAEPFRDALAAAELLIAADGGGNALWRAAIVPHLVIGDLDSLDAATLAWLSAHGCVLLRAPREKDETDLELALLLALERGATSIDMLGALGGRLDHTLANVAMLSMGKLAGRRVRILDTDQELLLLRGGEQLAIAGQQGDTVSLLPLSGSASGISIQGFYYPLQEATLRAEQARGVSNVLLSPPGVVALREGLLLVIHHFDGGAHQWASR